MQLIRRQPILSAHRGGETRLRFASTLVVGDGLRSCLSSNSSDKTVAEMLVLDAVTVHESETGRVNRTLKDGIKPNTEELHMGEPNATEPNNAVTPASESNAARAEKEPEIPSRKVLAGADELFDGAIHVGVAIEVAASGNVSYVMIPDATNITSGKPIYITAPVEIRGENLETYLTNKGVALTDELKKLLKSARIGCEAFYFSTDKEKLDTADKVTRYNADNGLKGAEAKKEGDVIERGPLLMMFEVAVDGGLIGTLSGDKDLGKLFDINSVMVRVLRCPASKRAVLENYVRQLPQA